MLDDPSNDDEERAQVLAVLRQAVAEKLSDKQRAMILSVLRGIPFDQMTIRAPWPNETKARASSSSTRCLRHYIAF